MFRSRCAIAALLAALCGAGLARETTATLAAAGRQANAPNKASADTIAATLATQEIVGFTLDQAKYRGSQARFVLADPAWPVDYALAFAVVLSYDDEAAQEEAADTLNASVPFAVAIATELANDRAYVANVLRNKSRAATARQKTRAVDEREEVARNSAITHTVVVRARELTAKLPELRTPDFTAAHASLKTRFGEAIAAHPEMLAPLVDELAVSDALRQSRGAIESLLNDVLHTPPERTR